MRSVRETISARYTARLTAYFRAHQEGITGIVVGQKESQVLSRAVLKQVHALDACKVSRSSVTSHHTDLTVGH